MESPEPSRSYMKRVGDERLDVKGDRVGEEEDMESSDKRKHRSSKSRKHNNAEETEEWDSGGKRKSSGGDRTESRKRLGGSSHAASGDEDDYETKKELRSKQVKKNHEDRTEKKSSSSYQDRELESSRKGRDVSVSKGHRPSDESERSSSRKTTSKPSGNEGSQSKSRSKVESYHDIEHDRDSRYSERKESSKDKGHGSREHETNLRRGWDESDSSRKAVESRKMDNVDSRIGRTSDIKHGSARDRTVDMRNGHGESKSRGLDSNNDQGIKSSTRDDKAADGERNKSKARSEVEQEDRRPTSITGEEKSSGLRDDNPRKIHEKSGGLIDDVEFGAHRSSTRSHVEKFEKHHDILERREKSDEDGHIRTRDMSGREITNAKHSWSPERGSRRYNESDDSQSDNERNFGLKGKKREKEGYSRDDRSRGRENNWSERNKDREDSNSKDNWKKRHYNNSNDKDTKDGSADFDHEKDWQLRRREHERTGSEHFHSQPGYRKRSGNESSEAIEIRPKPIEYVREESASTFTGRKNEVSNAPDFTSATSDEEWGYPPEERVKMPDNYGLADDPQDRHLDDGGSSMMDQNVGGKGRGQRGLMSANRSSVGGGGQTSSSGSQGPYGNNSFNRGPPQASKGSRLGRGGRGRLTGRDVQRVGIPMPMMGSPFSPLGLPQGPMQPLGPNMSPAHGPQIGLGVFIPQFPGPNVWPGPRGVDMNLLGVPPGLAPVPTGPSASRFTPNVGPGPGPNSAMFFNQPGPVRGVSLSPNIPGPGFNAMGSIGRGLANDKGPVGWGPPRPPGKAPSRGEQNDYSQNFVDTGMRPQNYIRELELTSVVEDYPKLRELIQKKDEIVAKSTTPPMYYKADLREFALTPEFFGTKFDVILVDPPWEEYVHRAPGATDPSDYWTFEEILNLKIEAIADTPSFIFLWVGDGVGLEQGRQCLKKWGFRRCEDICWVKTNKANATPGARHDSHTLFQHSKEHCLMGIKGTVRRSTDGHIIHANIDTDIIIAEEPEYGKTTKPEDMYRIIEHFSLGRRRLELFGEDHNIRSGWMTIGKGLSSSNFNAEAYIRNFADKDGKVWQGGGGRNPPPDTPHLVLTTPDIEGLRPKSPPQKNQQQSAVISLSQTTVNSTNRRPAGTSPNAIVVSQEASGSTPSTPAHWTPPVGASKGSDAVTVVPDEKLFDGFGYNTSRGQSSGEHPRPEFESQGSLNL
ncbi:hypothetical protein GIB67_037284 [Kingdonia uniflora]|uniref:Methyltransferase-like protein 1 n=1 Tax=Kingdonia uniflora TaxID=39325 RepID=A0A7J7MS23_9MAGN|nr:hypothetical protein GIB67_037284 [Kingdonia uniflora]